MNYYFITGSSRGLGKSLLDLLLKDESNIVYGLARTCSVEHERYYHTTIDLSNMDKVVKFQFPLLKSADKIIIINNAGIVGDVKRVGNIDNQKIINCYNLNLIAPVILVNNFVTKYGSLACEKVIINISSGAGRNPIDGWNVYCSSKAGIDMFSQVLNEETNIDKKNIKVLSLAPGIIDTDMQYQIRASDQSEFSTLEKFIQFKKEGDLVNPNITAKQILRFVNENELSKNVLCSVRDLKE